MKRKRIVNLSLLLMFFGFLLSIVGLFSGSIMASQGTTETGAIVFVWTVLAIVGVVSIIFGFIGFISSISAHE